LISLKILEMNRFMGKLLKSENFDGFLLKEGFLRTGMEYRFQGRVFPEYFDTEEQEKHTEEYTYWGEVKPFVFELVKGKRTPLAFSFTLLLTKNDTAELLVRRSVNVGEDKLDSLPYKAMYNPQSWNSYSVTEIADVVICSDGEGTPTPDKLVTREETNDPDVDTDAADTTAAPAPDTDPAATSEESTTATEPPKSGCQSTLGGAALTVMALSGAAIMARKKKEDQA